ncbi:MAG: tetratricopeptide repeat protein [Myxococcota bacterium]
MVRYPARLLTLAVALVASGALLACTGFFASEPTPTELAAARQQLADGQLPEAMATFQALHTAHPGSAEAASGLAYTLLLADRLAEADAVLAGVGQSSEVALRRALIAKRRGDFDGVREHGLASATPVGKVLAAEVLLIDLEVPRAVEVLSEVAATDGAAAGTAGEYLALVQHEDPIVRSLANPVALWSLGARQDACEGADRILRKLAADEDRSRRLLLWAGRAVTSDLPRIARGMVDEAVSVPAEHRWRAQATLAMVEVAEGNAKEGLRIFDSLRSARRGVPVDGLDDARITACGLARDPAVAQRLVDGIDTPAAARCLLEAGAVEAARSRRSGPALGRLLENL